MIKNSFLSCAAVLAIQLLISTSCVSNQNPAPVVSPAPAPEELKSAYQLGVSALKQGLYEKAAEQFRCSIHENPDADSAGQACLLALDALSRLDEPGKMPAYIDSLELEGNSNRLIEVLEDSENKDRIQKPVLALVSAYARRADVEHLRRFIPYCDEASRRDRDFNRALMDGGDAALSREEYLSALQFYRAVNRETSVENGYDVELMMRLAHCYDEMGRLRASCELYRHIYTAFPDNPSAEECCYKAFECLCTLQETAAAEETALFFLTHYTEGQHADDISLELMNIYIGTQDFQSAIDLGRALVSEEPPHRYLDQVAYLTGSLVFKRKGYSEARALFNQSARQGTDCLYAQDAVYWKGMCSYLLGKYEKAIDVFQDYLANPAWPEKKFKEDVNFRLGMAFYGLEKTKEAETQLQKFISEFPSSPLYANACNLLGDLLWDDGELDAALNTYSLAQNCAEDREQADYAVFQIARLYQLQEKYEEGIHLLENYLRTRGPGSRYADAAVLMSKMLNASGEDSRALDVCMDALIRYGNDPQAKDLFQIPDWLLKDASNRGEVKQRLLAARDDASKDESQKVLELRFTAMLAEMSEGSERKKYQDEILSQKELARLSPLALLVFAEAAAEQGDPDRARSVIDYIFKTSDLPVVVLQMVNTQLQARIDRGEYDQAFDLAQRALAVYPSETQSGLTYKLAGDAARLSGDYEKAVEMYEKLLADFKWRGELTPQALYWSGESVFEEGDPVKAYAYFQRVYVLYSGYPEWTAKAYAGTVRCLQALGKKEGIEETWREMVSIPEIAATPEGQGAKRQLDALRKEK